VTLDFNGMSSMQLLQLIGAATAELVRRQTPKAGMPGDPAATAEPVIVTPPGPTGDELRFVVALLTRLQTKKLIRAAEKDEYAALVERFGQWFRVHQYPVDLRGRGGDAFAEHGSLKHGK
jgi:hypothetical protein